MKENEELSFPEAVLSSSFPNLWLERKREERETASASLRSVHFLFLIFGTLVTWDGNWARAQRNCVPVPPHQPKIRYEKKMEVCLSLWLTFSLVFIFS